MSRASNHEERARAQTAFAALEDEYCAVFDFIDEGFCVAELIFDEAGAPVDLLYVKTNQSFERSTGLENTVGKTASELCPGVEPHWMELCIRVITTGKSERYENFSGDAGSWFDLYVSRIGGPGSHRSTIVFKDTTQRKRAKSALHESEKRQDFLVKLTDALRALADPGEVQTEATRVLGEHLGAVRVQYWQTEEDGEYFFSEGGYALGMQRVAGRYRVDDFGCHVREALTEGQILAVANLTTDSRVSEAQLTAYDTLGVRAYLAVPLVKNGRLVAILGVYRTDPYDWLDQDIALTNEVAERTWAAVERARAEAALRDSEAKFRTLFDSIDHGFYIAEGIQDETGRTIDRRVVEANPAFETATGLGKMVGKLMSQFAPRAETNWIEAFDHVVRTGESRRVEEFNADTGRWYQADHALIGGPGSRLVGVVFDDITERKRNETALRESEEQHDFLLKLSDALRAELSAEAVANRALRMLFEQMRLDRCYVGIYRVAEDIAEFPYQVHDNRLQPVPAELRLSDFPVSLKIAFDRTLVIDNIAENKEVSDRDRASLGDLGLGALVAATLRKGENNPLWAIVVGSMDPRAWTPGEVSLVEEFAERTWASVERTRAEAALRESEARRELALEAANMGTFMWHVEEDRGELDARLMGLFGQSPDGALNLSKAMTLVHPDDAAGYAAAVVEATKPDGSRELRHDIRVAVPGGGWRWIAITANVSFDAGGRPFQMSGTGVDITVRKTAETVLSESAERQAFLLKLGDALRPISEPLAVQVEAMRVLAQHLAVSRAQYYEIEPDNEWFKPGGGYENGAPLHSSRLRMDAFGAFVRNAYEGGQTLVISDTGLDARLKTAERAAFAANGVCSIIAVPLVKNGRFVGAIAVDQATARFWAPAEVVLVEEVAERTWAAVECARAEAAVREGEERFREFSDASTNALWIRDAKTLRMEFASPAFDKIFNVLGPSRGGDGRLRSWARLIEPESRKAALANFRRVRKGERVEQEFQIRRASDGTLRWIHDTGFPLRDANGDVQYIAGLGADITDVKETIDRQGVLVEELQHRTRNLIAVVRALSDRTLGNAASLEDFGARFRLRLSALSRVQGLLSHLAAGEKVTFKELLCSELAVYDATDGLAHKFTLEGPEDVPLPSTTVQTFALAIHELATNAIKYGALATADGHLFVGWRIDPAVGNDPPRLHVEWRESGVTMPAVDALVRGGGYGRELIERALPYQLKAKTTYELGVDGVRCTIAVPISPTASNGIFGSE